MATLISKPGITPAVAGLAVPTTWSASWFQSFITNYLKGADVRNAVGANGLVISGNLASPYATIGFAAPVTLPSPVTINAPSSVSTPTLTINAIANGYGIQVNQGDTGSQNGTGIRISRNGSTNNVIAEGPNLVLRDNNDATAGLIQFTSSSAAQLELWVNNGSWNEILVLNVPNTGSVAIGIGEQPNTWVDFFVSQLGNTGAIASYNGTGNNLWITRNTYWNGSSPISMTTDIGAQLLLGSSGFVYSSAPSVSAGSAQSYSVQFEVTSAGLTYFPNCGTTASAANAFLNSASSPANQLLRSTSSLRYKTNVNTIQSSDIDALMQMRPVTYTSLCAGDDPSTIHLGFIAEEMAAIDSRLVNYNPAQWQTVPGATVGAPPSVQPIPGPPVVPDSVQYDRITVLLVGAVQALAARVAALEGGTTLTAAASAIAAATAAQTQAPAPLPTPTLTDGVAGVSGTNIFTGTPVPYIVLPLQSTTEGEET